MYLRPAVSVAEQLLASAVDRASADSATVGTSAGVSGPVFADVAELVRGEYVTAISPRAPVGRDLDGDVRRAVFKISFRMVHALGLKEQCHRLPLQWSPGPACWGGSYEVVLGALIPGEAEKTFIQG